MRITADKPGSFLSLLKIAKIVIHLRGQIRFLIAYCNLFSVWLGSRSLGPFRKILEFLTFMVQWNILKVCYLELTAFPAPHYTTSLAVLKVALGFFSPREGGGSGS